MIKNTKTRIVLVVLVFLGQFVSLFSLTQTAGAYGPFDGGTGSAGNPYQISTCDELQSIGGSDHFDFVLTGNIDCSATSTWNSGAGFAPLLAFGGAINGNGHTISGLYINLPSSTNVGLFQTTLNGAIIVNLHMTGANITGGTSVGMLVGLVNNIFQSYGDPTYISGVSVSGTVNGTSQVGGLIGSSATVTLDRDSSSGSVSGNNLVGGLAGEIDNNATVTNVYSSANITATGSSPAFFGGLIGEASALSETFRDSYASGTISAVGAADVGGFMGWGNASDQIDHDFTLSPITDASTTAVGGFGGSLVYNSFNINNDYYDQTATGKSTCENVHDSWSGNPPGCTAINTTGTQGSYFYNNTTNAPLSVWDFTNTWTTTLGLPTLRSFTPILPSQPTLSGGASATEASLSWSTATTTNPLVPVQDYAVGYKLHSSSTWITVDVGSTATSEVINGLVGNAAYDFNVTAYDGEGAGLVSATLQLTTLTAPVNTITSGSGSSADPYQINDCQALQSMTFHLGAAYKLMGNIDCTASSTWNNGAGFLPIGLGQDLTTSNFGGSLDGQGYTISGLYINQAALNAQHAAAGLIGSLSGGGSISNMKLTAATVIGGGNALVNSGTDYVGGVVGAATDSSIKAVSFSGTVTNTGCAANMDIGGLVGSNVNGSIVQSSSAGSVTDSCASSNAVAVSIGGLVGYTNDTNFQQTVAITNDYSHAGVHSNVNDHSGIGGLIGFAGETTINASYASGSINYAVTGQSVGGLIGAADLFGPNVVTNSFTAIPIDSVHCSLYCGALVGKAATSGVSSYDYSSDYYDQTVVGLSQCDASGNATCHAVNTTGLNGSYFYNNTSNAPLASWDFSSVWTTSVKLPVFGAYVVPNPGPPTTLAGSAASDTRINLSWVAPTYTGSAPLSQYQVLYEITNSNSWQSVWTNSTSPNYVLTNLLPATSYTLQVVAENTNNQTGYGSAMVQVTTPVAGTYAISNCNQLQAMNNDLYGSYAITANIDCSATSSWNSGAGFVPIGTDSQPFKGTLEGHNYTISGLYESGGVIAGLFGSTSAATIQDLKLAAPVLSSTSLTGALVVNEQGGSTIRNVQVSGATLSVGTGDVGGLLAIVGDGSVLGQSSFTGTISLGGTDNSGGLVGLDTASVHPLVLANDFATQTTTGSGISYSSLGGLVGAVVHANGINLSNSYASGQISVTGTSSNEDIGGLIGYFYDYTGSSVTNSFASVGMSSTATSSYVGGLIGQSVIWFGGMDMSTDTFDITVAGTSTCVATGIANCSGINNASSQAGYFDNNSANAPLNAWDFASVWEVTSGLPVFNTPVTVTPVPSPVTSSGGGSTPLSKIVAILQLPVVPSQDVQATDVSAPIVQALVTGGANGAAPDSATSGQPDGNTHVAQKPASINFVPYAFVALALAGLASIILYRRRL